MRLIFLSIEFSIGTFSGNGIYAISQVRALQRLGHEVLVICGCPLSTDAVNVNPVADVHIHPIPLPVWGRLDLQSSWKEYAQQCGTESVVNLVTNFHAEAVIGVDWHSFAAYQQLAEALKRAGSPLPAYSCSNYRVYLRSVQLEEETEMIRKLEGASLCRSILATVLSRSDEKFVQENYYKNFADFWDSEDDQAQKTKPQDPPPLHVLLPALRNDIAAIPFPPSPSSFVETGTGAGNGSVAPITPLSGRKYLVSCVRPSPEKEPHRFVDLVIELERRGVFKKLNIVPLVAGAGWAADQKTNPYAANLRERLETHVPRCVIMQNFLGPTEMAGIYSQTLLNFHPPAYDAFGMTIIEAASQGAPSLVAHEGHVGATDLLSDEKGEVFVTDMEAEIEILADVVEELLDDRERLEKIGLAASKVAREWTEEANASRLIELVEKALKCEEEQGTSTNGTIATTSRNGIDVVPADSIDYEMFEKRYLEGNRPVILTGVTTEWRAAKDWVKQNNNDNEGGDHSGGNGGGVIVNIEFLAENFGVSKVCVTDTARRHRGGGPCREMTLAEYCEWWKARKESQHDSSEEGSESVLYLKDWHFTSDVSQYTAYVTPPFFLDDWLNEWYDSQQNSTIQKESSRFTCSDYRFVYLGASGSSTPLHADVLRSHSWSANIAGRKLWRLLPATKSHLILNSIGFDHPYDFFPDSTNPVKPIPELIQEQQASENNRETALRFPKLSEAHQHVLELIQYPGEAIFVPAGWFHTVYNLDDCLSINHNWISTQSLPISWQFLQRERCRAAQMIEDCRALAGPAEFEALVQRNVKMNAGMDYAGFGAMVRHVAESALEKIAKHSGGLETVVDSWLTVERGIKRLEASKNVLEEIVVEMETALPGIKELKGSDQAGADAEDEAAFLEALKAEFDRNIRCIESIKQRLHE